MFARRLYVVGAGRAPPPDAFVAALLAAVD